MEKLQEALKNSASEPTFAKGNAVVTDNKYAEMDYMTRHGEQINAAWDHLKGHSESAGKKLTEINKVNLEALQKKGIITNTITLADMGNFVISPELLSDIEGVRSDFAPFLDKLNWKETLSLQMSWLKRDGDVDMTEVENCDDGADGNLKPVKEYEFDLLTSNLHELAAVTPVCNAATRFAAVDLLGDVAQGYRTDFDRKKAQIAIVRLQQAINSTGNNVAYNLTTAADGLVSFVNCLAKCQEEIMNGIFVFNTKTYWELYRQCIKAGVSGPLATLFTTTNGIPTIAGAPYVIVPNELMPSLNTAETKSFTVEGSAVTINHAVFYFAPRTFAGRTSGGLKYDLSTEAAYESGQTVKSAFQRNELVLRGSFFRGAAIKDEDLVSSMSAAGIS